MAVMDTTGLKKGKKQRRSLLPREHGVYVQVVFPLLTALSLGTPSAGGVLLVVAIICVFLLHEPVLVVLGRRGPRLQQALAQVARRRALLLGLLSFASGAAGIWMAGGEAKMASLLALPVAGVLVWLIASRREKSWFGECLLAIALAIGSVPVSLACGVGMRAAILAACAWALVFVLATSTVHALLARAKRNERTPSMIIVACALSLIVGAAALLDREWWSLSIAPMALVCLFVVVAQVSPRSLRRVGWSFVFSNILTAAALIACLR